MPRLIYEFPFRCPSCKSRTSTTTAEGKCFTCGCDLTRIAYDANEGWYYKYVFGGLFLFLTLMFLNIIFSAF